MIGSARRIPTRNGNGRRLGSKTDHVRRGLATKSSTTCDTLEYLVVHPSLIHIITLKYARTLHKRRPRDNVRMHLRTLTRITRAARSHVCRHVCSNMQAAHMKPARKAGDCTAHRRGIASRGSRGRRIAGPSPCTELPAKSLREREGGERSSEEGCCCEGGR